MKLGLLKLSAAVLSLALLVSCGSSKKKQGGYIDLDSIEMPTGTAKTVTLPPQETTESELDSDYDTADPKAKSENDEDVDDEELAPYEEFVWQYNGVSLTLPAKWAGRYEIVDNTLYVKKIYKKQLGKGALFHIEQTSDPMPDNNYWYLLGIDQSGEYYFACTENGVTFDPEPKFNEEYDNMMFDLESVLQTATCEATLNDKPIDVSMYDNWVSGSTPLRGFWNLDGKDYDQKQTGPNVVFDIDANRIGFFNYDDSGSYSVGRLMFNRNSDSYANNPWNDSDHGIVYLAGSVYKVRVTFAAVNTVNFELVMGGGSALTEYGFIFVDDYGYMYTDW